MLKIDNLNLTAGTFKVKNVSLKLEEDRCHVLVGTTGSGKTLILETIAGLRTQNSGTIVYADRDIGMLPPEQRNISYLPQDLCLFPNMSVRDNIAYSLRIKKIPPQTISARINELAEALDISQLLDRDVANLSGGEKHRTALARAIVSQNPLLLLDEPFSSLNLGIKRKLWHLLKKLQHKHRLTTLLVTHDLEEALFLGDELSLITNGTIIDSGPKQKVYNYPLSISAACILGTENFLKAQLTHKDEHNCTFFCPEIGTELSVSANHPHLKDVSNCTITLAIRSTDIRVTQADESAGAVVLKVESIFTKGRTATMILAHPATDFKLQTEVELAVSQTFSLNDHAAITVSPELIMPIALLQDHQRQAS